MVNLSRKQWAGAWCAAVIVASAGAVAFGAGITVGNGVLFLLACLVPPAVMLLVWRPPPATVAQLLYDVNARPEQRNDQHENISASPCSGSSSSCCPSTLRTVRLPHSLLGSPLARVLAGAPGDVDLACP
jgi:hypothetical protein